MPCCKSGDHVSRNTITGKKSIPLFIYSANIGGVLTVHKQCPCMMALANKQTNV